jgi:hypothetical protein
MKGHVDKSMGIVTHITEVLVRINPTDPLRLANRETHKKRNWSDSSGNSPAKVLVSRKKEIERGFILLWINKVKSKDKIYMWVSVLWKTKNKTKEFTRLSYTERRGRSQKKKYIKKRDLKKETKSPSLSTWTERRPDRSTDDDGCLLWIKKTRSKLFIINRESES